MSEVKLLPLPEPGEAMSKWAYHETDMEAYARANMEPLLRERDALRNRLEDTVRDLTDVKAENERLRGDLDLAEIKDFLRRAAPYARAIVRAQTEIEEREASRALAKLYNDDLDALLSREGEK